MPNGSFPDKDAILILRKLRRFLHPNIVQLFGIIQTDLRLLFVSEYADKGDLDSALKISSMEDWELRSSLLFDLIEGLTAIHHSPLIRHGNLSLTKCLINKRFMLKLAGLGFKDILKNREHCLENKPYSTNLQSIPPELRSRISCERGIGSTSSSDVYVFADIAHALLSEHVFKSAETEQIPDHKLKKGAAARNAVVFNDFQTLLHKCHDDDPSQRPTIDRIRKICQSSFGINNQNFAQKILLRLERYASQLEDTVAERTQEFIKETEANEALLRELLPKQIVQRLKKDTAIAPESFDCVSLLFSYTTGFNEFVAKNSDVPLNVVRFLDHMFVSFDDIVSLYDVYKVETINDSCMVASGLPERNEDRHAKEICHCALGFRKKF
ncbi:receptor-type guanylate cyclase gcy-22-like [Paramacrobiotus metropolitanus]|uniref:receptor-type guanylate cyclase gcy-22-like n=1 Tax=Paramacrobiotus metropolitanus TaxID=2943436 RepID=UPI002445655A|nr:receptor-type guanylate cyclase gcy-22-like [Paramacrobiotus metropolitanus]